jgi:hypothetical protein
MDYLDHEPRAWFLAEEQSILYLDARYSCSGLIDDSALIRLDEAELEAYDAGGHDYLSDLAMRIQDSAPYREESQYFSRDLYRSDPDKRFEEAVTQAIADHTWSAEHRQTP